MRNTFRVFINYTNFYVNCDSMTFFCSIEQKIYYMRLFNEFWENFWNGVK